jgi:hypothetical protein
MAKGIKSCAACSENPDPSKCRKFNNIISRLFGLLFKSDRSACIAQIRQVGIDGHANIMAQTQRRTIKRQPL